MSYRIRPYEPADRAGFLSLFETVFDSRPSPAWFAWKYEENPYVDHVPIVVAEHAGELVGARSFFALPVAAGADRYDALQPCDTMVHPDHQRRGLFTRMTEHAIERYDDVDFFFNFPNHRSLPANLGLGWRVVDTRETYYRIRDPGAWVPGLGPAAPLARSVVGAYLGVRDRLASHGEFSLARCAGVPASLLAALADPVPEFHVAREERFYDWRFASPTRTYRTMVARRGSRPVAAVVYCLRTPEEGPRAVRLVEVLPLGSETPDRTDALAACLDGILRTTPDADVVVAPGDVLPRALLTERGFHGDGHVPLRWVTSATTQVVRPPGPTPDSWRRSGMALAEGGNWRLALCEVDSE